MANIPVIPTQFEVTTLWESGSSKVESVFIKTRISPQAVTCASFEYYRNATSQLKLGADRGSPPGASAWRILPSFRREAIMDFQKLDERKPDASTYRFITHSS